MNFQKHIQQSPACPAKLHALARATPCNSLNLLLFSREWFHITRTFGLNAPRSLNQVAIYIQSFAIHSPEAMLGEWILQQVSAIAVDDLGQARGESENKQVHFRLFEKQCQPLLLLYPEIDLYQSPSLPSTKNIMQEIQESFMGSISDILLEFAVIEGIALEIVNAMHPLYTRCTNSVGELVYHHEEMIEYVTLHQCIEGEHANESIKMIETWLLSHPLQKNSSIRKLNYKLTLWGNFWKEATKMLFK